MRRHGPQLRLAPYAGGNKDHILLRMPMCNQQRLVLPTAELASASSGADLGLLSAAPHLGGDVAHGVALRLFNDVLPACMLPSFVHNWLQLPHHLFAGQPDRLQPRFPSVLGTSPHIQREGLDWGPSV